MYIFANFKVFSDIMSLVNFTSLHFSHALFLLQYKCAVFHNCQKHLDDKTHLHRNTFRLNPFSQWSAKRNSYENQSI